jgi:hypothetical protein
MSYTPKYGDLANGRIGNGVHEYDVPVTSEAFAGGALVVQNLKATFSGVHLADPANDGTLIFRMPSSYVYLGGELQMDSVIDGKITFCFSENNGLDWKTVAVIATSGPKTIDLKPLVFRRYDYQLKLVLSGAGTRLKRLYIRHDIQHSQRPLPALVQGSNMIRFSSGTEGTITIEGSTPLANRGKQVLALDFHPDLHNIGEPMLSVKGGNGSALFSICTPGVMKRMRIFCFYRARSEADRWDVGVSFDEGTTFQSVGTLDGPFKAMGKQLIFSDIPAGATSARVRFSGTQREEAMLFNVRLDADYTEPRGGSAPVKVTYVWEEDGAEKHASHLTGSAEESWIIECRGKPVMKSLIVER